MTTLYKLTDREGWTRAGHDNACLWGEGVTHSGTGEGELCGRGWVHAYEHPLLAVVLTPIHANFSAPRMWIAEGEIAKRDGQLKVGCRTLTTLREIPLPVVSTNARIRFAILCAKKVYAEPSWSTWAENWLAGKDRSEAAARMAEKAANAAKAKAAKAALAAALTAVEAAKEKAANAAALTAAKAERAAAERAENAAWAAEAAAEAARAEKEKAWAAEAEAAEAEAAWEAWAARAAAVAVVVAAKAEADIDLAALLEQAVRDEAVNAKV